MALKRIPRPISGYTLLELLVALVILGVLTGLALPSMSSLLRSLKTKSATDALRSSLALTRAEAIKRNTRVVMCRSKDGLACASSGGWEQGWIVFADSRNNATREAGEPIMLRQIALSDGVMITPRFTVGSYISYSPLGRAQTVNGAMLMGNFTICQKSSGPTEVRKIILSAAGRPRLAKSTEAHCP